MERSLQPHVFETFQKSRRDVIIIEKQLIVLNKLRRSDIDFLSSAAADFDRTMICIFYNNISLSGFVFKINNVSNTCGLLFLRICIPYYPTKTSIPSFANMELGKSF